MLILQPNRITTLIKCKKTFDEMRNKRNELLTNIWLKIIHKNKNDACCNENHMDSKVEVTSCSKDKGKKGVF